MQLLEQYSYSLKVLAICLFGWTIANMDQSFFGYAIPSIMEEFNVDLVFIGVILTAAFLVSVVSVVISGFLADKYGRRNLFAVCLSISALLVGLHSMAPSVEAMAALRIAAFAISTGLVPITNAMIVETAPAKYRGIFGGIMQCGYPLGWFLASLIAIPLMSNYGWRSIFLPAFAVIPIAILIARSLPESDKHVDSIAKENENTLSFMDRLQIIFSREYRLRAILGWTAFLGYGGAYAGTAFYFPTFFQEVRGYTLEDSTALVGLSYGVGVIGYLGASLVGEFVTTRRNTVVIWTWVGAIAVCFLIWPDNGYAYDMTLFSIMAMFFYGTSAVLTIFVSELFPTHIRATAVGAVAGMGINLGFALYPVIVATLVELHGWKLAFTIAIVPSLFAAGLATLFQPNLKSGTELQ